MGDENPRRTLGDYSRPSHEGYRNTIEVPNGNDLAPLRSDTIRLVQNGCSFHGLRSENPNQHLKDFLKIVDSIDLNVETRERTRLHLFQFWNDPRDFAKPVKAISMPHDVPSASGPRLIELENQAQRMMEAHLSQSKPVKVNKISSSCEICSGPHDTQYFMENPEKTFVDYASLRSNRVGGKPFATNQGPRTFNEAAHAWKDKPNFGTKPRNKEVIKSSTKLLALKYHEHPSSITIDKKTPPSPRRVHFVNTTTLVKKERESRDTTLREHEGLTSEVDDEVGSNELEEEEEDDLEYFNTFPSMKELEYHEWLLKNPRPPWVRAKIRTKNLNNIKISCMIGHNLEKQVYIDFESPINVMSRRHYKQIMSQKLESRKNQDTTSIIDHDLGEIAFGKPFIEQTGLAYDKEEGTIVFRRNDEKITFKMPHKMEKFRHVDLKDMNTDPIPPLILGSKNEHGKVYYSNSLIIGTRKEESRRE
ncbi:hypothetical protein Tco_0727631 [Tanacetum coccineum]|uniref:MAK10-like protein n=1 Tax=Tanacetum coccineum TaxID=301880 RepID=A0ABQ4YJU0_9ASTR